MELRDWVAIIGVSYGIASDFIGGSGRCKSNSVAGLLLSYVRRTLSRFYGSEPGIKANYEHPPLINYAYLIELGYRYRQRLLQTQKADRVDVGLYGEHLVLTVYKQPDSDA